MTNAKFLSRFAILIKINAASHLYLAFGTSNLALNFL
jgi:hypothetical protein